MAKDENLNQEKVHLIINKHLNCEYDLANGSTSFETIIRTPNREISTRTKNQFRYIQAIRTHDLSFGIGPAGTGKTYLAVAAAIESLQNQEVKKIILVRPAVEAGESLGFLPGDLSQKVDPYLRPLLSQSLLSFFIKLDLDSVMLKINCAKSIINVSLPDARLYTFPLTPIVAALITPFAISSA